MECLRKANWRGWGYKHAIKIRKILNPKHQILNSFKIRNYNINRKEWIGSNAKALGVYMALLLVRFRVRLRIDIPILYSDEGIIEQRLEPYLSIFLRDKNKKLIEAIDAGKEFFKQIF